MPDSELIGLRYVSSGTMARPEFEGSVKMDSAGVFVLKAMKENYIKFKRAVAVCENKKIAFDDPGLPA